MSVSFATYSLHLLNMYILLYLQSIELGMDHKSATHETHGYLSLLLGCRVGHKIAWGFGALQR